MKYSEMNKEARLLRHFMHTFKWSKTALAKDVGVSITTISNAVDGRPISFETEYKLKKFFERHAEEVSFL